MHDTTRSLLFITGAFLIGLGPLHLAAESATPSTKTIVSMAGGLDPGSSAMQPDSRIVYVGGDVRLQIRADGTATVSPIALREGARENGAIRWESTVTFTPGLGQGSIFSVTGTGTVTEAPAGKAASTREGTWSAALDDEGNYRLSATGVSASLLLNQEVGGSADVLQAQYIAFFDRLEEKGNRCLAHMFRLERRLGGDPLTCVKALCADKQPIMTKPNPTNADRFVSADLVQLAMAYLRRGIDSDGKTGYEQGEYILRAILKTPMYKWGVRGGAVVWNDEKAREIAEQLVPEFFNESGREGHKDPVIRLLGQ